MPPRMRPMLDRFWEKVDRRGPDECWLWTASTVEGYGQIGRGRAGTGMALAHRVAYEALVGPIPDGLQLDHLCRVTRCVNPAHLEPVTIGENLRRGIGPSATNHRKTHCLRGHPFDEANTRIDKRGHRRCRECARFQQSPQYPERQVRFYKRRIDKRGHRRSIPSVRCASTSAVALRETS